MSNFTQYRVQMYMKFSNYTHELGQTHKKFSYKCCKIMKMKR